MREIQREQHFDNSQQLYGVTLEERMKHAQDKLEIKPWILAAYHGTLTSDHLQGLTPEEIDMIHYIPDHAFRGVCKYMCLTNRLIV